MPLPLPAGADKPLLRRALRAERSRRLAHSDPSAAAGSMLPDRSADELLARARTSRAQANAAPPGTGLAPSGPLRVAAFHPMPTEPDVLPVIAAFVARHAQILMPVAAGALLDWAVWDGEAPMIPSPERGFGAEPAGARLGTSALAGVDLVLAPALAVDESGTRLGHGRGLYDRALTHARRSVPAIAVVHPWEVLPGGSLPHEEHDRPVHGVLTTAGLRILPDI